MKKLVWFRTLVVVAVTVMLLAGTAAVFPHFHPEVGGREQESCTPCFLHQTVQPLVESGFSLAPKALLNQVLVSAPDRPVLSHGTTGCLHSRAPPVFP